MADTPLEMSELFGIHTDDKAVDEASKFPTVPAGKYEAKLDTRQTLVGTDENYKETYNRQYARVSFPAMNGQGKKIGRVQFNLSWIEKRTPKGFQDRPYQLFNRVVGAMGMKGKEVGEVLTAMMEYPLIWTVAELYEDPTPDPGTGKKAWKDVTTDNRDFVNKNGFRTINNVVGVSKVKA